MIITVQDRVEANVLGFSWLAQLSNNIFNLSSREITMDFGISTFFEANMAAPLGALLEMCESNNNKIFITNLNPGVKAILGKNGFLERFKVCNKVNDQHQTTIGYKKFELTELLPFTKYVVGNFYGNDNLRENAMPNMDITVWTQFITSITEIFNNAKTHSESLFGVYCCGQFYPNKHKLSFTLCDLGIGIKSRIEKSLSKTMNASKAIEWAVDKRNTTKQNKPGGLGLKELKNFLIHNKGCLDIVSDSGYWFLAADTGETKELDNVFHGTIINIEINTNDVYVYEMNDDANRINRFLNYKKE